MLAQSFKSAADLEITEPQRDALQKVLVLLETGKLAHSLFNDAEPESPTFSGLFNMTNWYASHRCGTVACIGGTAELISGVKFDNWALNDGLYKLFAPTDLGTTTYERATPAQAARALRSYLTTGDAKWDEAAA
jgi:hypothetical protein